MELAFDGGGGGAYGDGDGEAGGVEGVGLAGVEADGLVGGWGEVAAGEAGEGARYSVECAVRIDAMNVGAEGFGLIEKKGWRIKLESDKAFVAAGGLATVKKEQKVSNRAIRRAFFAPNSDARQWI